MNFYQNLNNKIQSKKAVISIMGMGYVGLPLAISFAQRKFTVVGLDKNKERIKLLKNKQSYVEDIKKKDLEKYINKNFYPTSNFSTVKKSDIIIICVPTPIDKNKKPILKYVKNAIEQIERYLIKGKLIILECTSYPGTTEDIILPVLKKRKLELGINFFLGYSPERVDPGNVKFSLFKKNIPKVVSGYTNNCLDLTNNIYKNISNITHKVSNLKTAEFSKLLENIYRSVNISLVNELKKITDVLKIDIHEAIKAASTKPFGFQAFYPGPGVGGHCIPVDPFFLNWKAKKLGINLKFIDLAGNVNDEIPDVIVNKIEKYIKKIFKKNYKNINFYLLGATYKKDSYDVRESPSIKIMKIMKSKKFNFNICEPNINNDTYKYLKQFNYISEKKLYKIKYKKTNIAIICTDHSKFDYNKIYKNFSLIFDCKNCYNFKSDKIIKI